MNKDNKTSVVVIGAGVAGISAACYLSQAGYHVTIVEKNDQTGGRMSMWESNGYTFDLGPSWYWMKDVFEEFFADFGRTQEEFFDLVRLDPGYTIFFEHKNVTLPADMNEIYSTFDQLEEGGGLALKKFMKHAEFTYKKGVSDYMRRPSNSIFEFVNPEFLWGVFRSGLLSSYGKQIDSQFQSQEARWLLNFPTLFLGSTPHKTPYLYSLMAYTQIHGGTWYPMGGMYEITKAMTQIALNQGVQIQLNTEVTEIVTKENQATGVKVAQNGKETTIPCDYIIGASDYHHIEQTLLPKNKRRYSESYWDSRTMCPSSLLFYIGVNRKIPHLTHHNLMFDADFDQHADEIYNNPQWPEDPLMYICAPSKTDSSVAPKGCENLFVLIPLAPGLEDTQEMRDKYFEQVIQKIQKHTGVNISSHIEVNRSFAMSDFESRYNSFKGNAYGLANTLLQTAVLKPKLKSKLNNMFYAGQLTVPGPGLPPSLISGKLAAKHIISS